ncbi:pentatricopeptide repeat protein [Talaromyces stipitatus ATCC 10500]|uniref:Pentatricopeptide repeat protein n=1 Tax=Talaromyces stipitatus (strain ATCC 10500 / CBS 375.48 / QM 6759 / NRRL 1006) TaxID=441959 RepID=B8LVE1_TALSN|nr:pentatricopeptide repeat protein [Talaromyces stipitatus ATCC 10500]EED23960.1 pentatricopeptide repeat protein [Talaromyces stipitatus ATCC 10500]
MQDDNSQSNSLAIRRIEVDKVRLTKYPSRSTEKVNPKRQNAALRLRDKKFVWVNLNGKKSGQEDHSPLKFYTQEDEGVPLKVRDSVRRAEIALRRQGRFITKEAFEHDIKIRLSSMFSVEGVPRSEGKLEAWHPPAMIDTGTHQLFNSLKEKGVEGFKELWEVYGERAKSRQWPLIALQILSTTPALMPDFLIATDSAPYPPFSMVSDCMLYLHYFHKEVDPRARRAALLQCMDPERWPVILLPQRGVRLYAMSAGQQNAYRAMDIMRSRDSQISAYTLLAFMNVCTQAGDVTRALECLRAIAAIEDRQGLSMNSEAILRHCCKLLELDEVVEEDGLRNFKILPQVLKLGVTPCLEMMNVVLSNAFDTGDPHLGLDMLDYMKGQGMEFSSYTYVILLSDAVKRMDRERVDTLLQEINLRPELKDNQYVASKVFHSHYIFGAKHAYRSDNPGRHFTDLMDVYCRYFDPTPLRELGIIPQRFNTVDIPRDTQPSRVILMIMMAAYLRCNPRNTATIRLYKRFCELVAQRHPVITPLVELAQVYNEFIISFRPFGADLKECVSIVEDMVQSEPFELGDRIITPAKPNAYTWNTLMSVFVSHRDVDGVASVREIMRQSGVPLNAVTWNVIINGTVRNQDIPATVAAMREMDEHGFSPDNFTVKALRLARDPERLQAAIEALDQETEKLMEEEMKLLERQNEELLDQGLKRLAIAMKKH